MNEPTPANETLGLRLGLLGTAIFAMTLPMTRLAVGAADDPQLPPLFAAVGRAAAAGVLSVFYLGLTGAPRLRRRHVPELLVAAAGSVIAFPLFLALALRTVDAMHAAVVSGLMPLGTAAAAAIYFRRRPSLGFWICALAGCGLVVAFAASRGGGLTLADGFLLLAVLSASIAYVAGARVACDLPAEQVICWVLVISLPLTMPLAYFAWPTTEIRLGSWLGFAYTAVFSMWLGFFAWYRGLAVGGAVRVSQVQLVQPFLALLFAVPVLGETLETSTVAFSLAVIAVVFVGKRMPADVG